MLGGKAYLRMIYTHRTIIINRSTTEFTITDKKKNHYTSLNPLPEARITCLVSSL